MAVQELFRLLDTFHFRCQKLRHDILCFQLVVQSVFRRALLLLRALDAGLHGVLPQFGGHVPVLDRAVLGHGVADGDAGDGLVGVVAEEVARRAATTRIIGWDGAVVGFEDGAGRVFAGKAGAGGVPAWIEDDGGDFICGGELDCWEMMRVGLTVPPPYSVWDGGKAVAWAMVFDSRRRVGQGDLLAPGII